MPLLYYYNRNRHRETEKEQDAYRYSIGKAFVDIYVDGKWSHVIRSTGRRGAKKKLNYHLPGVRLAHPVEWHNSSNSNIRLLAMGITLETLTDDHTDMMKYLFLIFLSKFFSLLPGRHGKNEMMMTVKYKNWLSWRFVFVCFSFIQAGIDNIMRHFQQRRATTTSRGFYYR